jgi:hypothetical protein
MRVDGRNQSLNMKESKTAEVNDPINEKKNCLLLIP